MYARISFYDIATGSRDDAVRAFEAARPALARMEGTRGGILLVSTAGDEAMPVTFWASHAALRASGDAADRTRKEAARSGGLSVRAVKAFEVALDLGAGGRSD